MIWLTAAIAFFALCSIIVGVFQWSAMRGQLAEMHSGGIDTHDLAVAAGRQARDTERLAEQAEQSSKLAERTLEAFEVQQRAWVALATPPKLQPAENGVIWSLRNFGSSPAFHIYARGINVEQPSEISAAQGKICREIGTAETWELLFPGEVGRPRAAFVVGAPVLHVVGCIKYRDQFSLSRWTKFCYEPDSREPGSFISCLGYNSTDADEGSNGRQSPN
jgi:hypothetical protein